MPEATHPSLIKREQFEELLKWGAFLGREFLGAEETNRFKGKVIYVCDTNIFELYSAPWEWGPLTGRARAGIGQLLPRLYRLAAPKRLDPEIRDDLTKRRFREDRLAIRMANLLAQDVVDTVTLNSTKIWQLPAHHDETDGFRFWVKQKLSEQGRLYDPKREEERKRIIKEFSGGVLKVAKKQNREISPEFLLDRILEEIMLREVLTTSGLSVRNSRLENLQSEPLEPSNLRDAIGFDDEASQSLADPYTEVETDAKRFLEWYWQEQLTDRMGPLRQAIEPKSESLDGGQSKDMARGIASAQKQRERDAQALTDLTIYNNRLLFAGIDARIVFVTGARRLVEATYRGDRRIADECDNLLEKFCEDKSAKESRRVANSVKAFFFGENGGSEHPAWFDRIGVRCVRHVHAFAQKTIVPEPAERAEKKEEDERKNKVLRTQELFTFFDGLFAYNAETILQSRVHLEEIALGNENGVVPRKNQEQKADVFQGIYVDSIGKWDKLLHRAVRFERFRDWVDPGSSDNMSETLRSLVDGEIDTVTDQLSELVERSRDRSLLQFSNISIDGLKKKNRISVRNPPDLIFTKLEKSKQIFDNLSSMDGYRSLPAWRFRSDFEALEQEGAKFSLDTTGRLECHLKYLALAATFYAAERWTIAEGHAQRAYAIIRRAEDQKHPLVPPELKMKGERPHFTGREALFILAGCRRLLAKIGEGGRTGDEIIVPALEALNLSDEALGRDYDSGERMKMDVMKFRSITERLSIRMAGFYIDAQRCSNPGCGEDQKFCDDCQSLGHALGEQFDDLIGHRDAKCYLKEPDVPTLTDVSMSLNVIQLHLLAHYEICSKQHVWVNEEILSRATDALGKASKDNSYILNEVARSYWLAGQILLGRHLEDDDAAKNQRKVRSQVEAENLLPTPATYDPWRLNLLKEFIQSSSVLEQCEPL